MREDYFLPCHRIRFQTPKGVLLDGLWFGPKRPKQVLVFVHGLSGSAFSLSMLVSAIASPTTAVLTFNNRGFELVAKMRLAGKRKWIASGAALEKFTDCVDDIEGAIRFVRHRGIKSVYLAGQSTGCQKSVYWAYKKNSRGVKGIILLAPLSDYAAMVHERGAAAVTRALRAAKKLVRSGKGNGLLPRNIWPDPVGAQRFVSLYSGKSAEELFPYWDSRRIPSALRSTRAPLLVVLAGAEEHGKESPKQLAAWYGKHIKRTDRVAIIPRVKHNFGGGEKNVAREIRKFIG